MLRAMSSASFCAPSTLSRQLCHLRLRPNTIVCSLPQVRTLISKSSRSSDGCVRNELNNKSIANILLQIRNSSIVDSINKWPLSEKVAGLGCLILIAMLVSVGVELYPPWKERNTYLGEDEAKSDIEYTSERDIAKLQELESSWDINTNLTDAQWPEELMKRAGDILEVYKKSHYVFIHGQEASWYPLYRWFDLINDNQYEAYNHLAITDGNLSRMDELDIIKDSLWRFQNSYKGSAKPGGEDDVILGGVYLSVDANFKNKQIEESASYFLGKNENIIRFSPHWCLFTEIFDFNGFTPELTDLSKIPIRKTKCGNLLVVIIPKELFHDNHVIHPIFSSGPFGVPVRGNYPNAYHLNKEDLELLERAQNGEDVECQYRIFKKLLHPKKGVIIKYLTPENKEELAHIDSQVQEVIDKHKAEHQRVIASREGQKKPMYAF